MRKVRWIGWGYRVEGFDSGIQSDDWFGEEMLVDGVLRRGGVTFESPRISLVAFESALGLVSRIRVGNCAVVCGVVNCTLVGFIDELFRDAIESAVN